MSTVRLNQAQAQAVAHDLGPLLVLAGAGSGKTGVVTQRIARLLRSGVAGRSILAMTFTNKAAQEMHERVVRLAGAKPTAGLTVCTFHRFGLEVLGREARAMGLRGGRFAIFDRGDSMGVLRDALRNVTGPRNYDVGAVLNRISLAKNAFVDAVAYADRTAESEDEYDEITALAYPRYEQALGALQAFDFDDLVCEPVRLWRRRPEVLERWRMRFRYLIVDEYQDTNVAQLEMLRLLAADHHNLCVVGDDDQSIYAWRGADVRNILDFPEHFPGTKVVRLEHNYRSSEAILEVANAVLASSSAKRHDKRLIPTLGSGAKVKAIVARDGETEARFVADEAHRLIEQGARPRELAVLYRSNLQAPELETELKARGVPYQLFGGTQTYERKEVKDLLAYLEAAVQPSSELAVRRSINYPARGIGDVALKALGSHATLQGSSLLRAVERSHAIAGLSDGAREGCRAYLRIIEEVRSGIDSGRPAGEVVAQLCETIGLKGAIFAESGQNNKAAGRRWGNAQALVRTFERRHGREPLAGREGWGQFLRSLLLREDADDSGDPADKVTLTTMHGAKGLEFGVVFVVGLEEGLLPHSRTVEERATDAPPLDGHALDEVEQERRLFYVAITRARAELYLCRALGRIARGKLLKRAPSRFLLQIPESLLDLREVLEPPQPDLVQVHRGARDVLAAITGAG